MAAPDHEATFSSPGVNNRYEGQSGNYTGLPAGFARKHVVCGYPRSVPPLQPTNLQRPRRIITRKERQRRRDGDVRMVPRAARVENLVSGRRVADLKRFAFENEVVAERQISSDGQVPRPDRPLQLCSAISHQLRADS